MRVLSDLELYLPGGAGEAGRFAELRAREFGRLDETGQVYLDYTGSGLYGRTQIEHHRDFLERHLLGNPHSASPASMLATEVVAEARDRVLAFFGADPADYAVVFTANASAAIKLVGEAYPFQAGSRLVLLQDNHNSVNGLRRFAEARSSEVCYLALDRELRLAEPVPRPDRGGAGRRAPSLFAFPGQSNFSGVRHPLDLVSRAREAGYDVLLDAAALAPTSPLDLDRVGADFVALSFYKMFGFPTGIGALVARREALARLRRPWFAGGTVDFVSVQNRLHRLRPGPAGFEDGTPNFLGLAAVATGLGFLASVGMEAVHRHVARLTAGLLDGLAGLRHPNGRPRVRIYGPGAAADRGGTVAFNLLDREGRIVPYEWVERAAGRRSIHLRGGCFCNPGAAEAAFEMPAVRARRCLESLPPGGFDPLRLAKCVGDGVAVGALRASLGIASTEADLERLLELLAEPSLTVMGGAPARG